MTAMPHMDTVRDCMDAAFRKQQANQATHHIAYFILDELTGLPDIARFLEKKHISTQFRGTLAEYIFRRSNVNASYSTMTASTQLQEVLRLAAIHAHHNGSTAIGNIDVLVGCAIAGPKYNKAAHIKESELDRILLRLANTMLPEELQDMDIASISGGESLAHEAYARMQEKKYPVATVSATRGVIDEDMAFLKQYGVFIARDAEGSSLSGREKEIERLSNIMKLVRKPRALIVGKTGVGKTSLVDAYVQKTCQIVFAVNMRKLAERPEKMAEIFGQIIDKAKSYKDHFTLFIDEAHMLFGATRTGGSPLDLANMIKPDSSGSELQAIFATTRDEYRKFIEPDMAFLRRVYKVELDEMDRASAIKAMIAGSKDIALGHAVTFDPEVFAFAYDTGKRFCSSEVMPDCGLDILDMAAVFAAGHRVGIKHIEQAVELKSGKDRTLIGQNEYDALLDMEDTLLEGIIGQEGPVKALVKRIRDTAVQGKTKTKNRMTVVLSGPTGVGKTEVTKLAAEALGLEMIRIDMSEYMEKHTVSRLIGAPPGYVGFDMGGIMTEAVKHSPYSVLLLDEVEKAHPDIFNLLLQVMDHGMLTDGRGKEVDFKNVIIVMTTNMGEQKRGKAIGFNAAKDDSAPSEAYKDFFKPELRGRIDALIRFEELEREGMERISGIFMEKSRKEFEQKHGIRFVFNQAVIEAIADNGFDPEENARSVEKYISDNVLTVLTMPIIRREVERGDTVRLTYNKEAGFGWEKLACSQDMPRPVTTALIALPHSQGATPS